MKSVWLSTLSGTAFCFLSKSLHVGLRLCICIPPEWDACLTQAPVAGGSTTAEATPG
ncbi:hypothetical protein GCM10020219_028920 [Nonomuraea dietziae]